MHCEFLLWEFCKPRWISTLNQKNLFFVITSLTTTQFEYGLLFRWNQKNQGHHIKKSFGRAPYKEKFWETRLPGDSRGFYEEEGEFEILTLASWFSHYSYSRMSIRSSMGGWLSKYSMLSKVLRRKKKKKWKEKKRRIKCSLVLFGFINFPSYFEELFHTQIFQPCAIR